MADAAFQFVCWWTSADTQVAYGLEVESMYGVMMRYYPASIEAFERMGWTAEEEAIMWAQMEWLEGMPIIPASYIVARSLTSALRRSVDGTLQPRRALNIFNRDMNYEIDRRAREFERLRERSN